MGMKKTSRNRYSPQRNLLMVAAIGITMQGCGSETPDDVTNLDNREQGSLGTNSLGTNSLGTNSLGTNSLGTNSLGTNSLGTNSLGTNSLGTNGINWLNADQVSKSDRFQLLKYLVKCALGPGQYLVVSAADSGERTAQTLYGMYNLAPDWLTRGIYEYYEQRWVSACVLAHVNQQGRAQRISLHGIPSGFASVPAERATMYSAEGRYWGNIFHTDQSAIQLSSGTYFPWKHVCSTLRDTGYDSPRNFDLILGRSCADDGCSVMTSNGRCPLKTTLESERYGWVNYSTLYSVNGYSEYGYVYQPAVAGSTTPNANGYFPTIEALGPVSLEFEGNRGLFDPVYTYRANLAYNNGLDTATVSTIVAGSGPITPYDCPSGTKCSIDFSSPVDHPTGQKLRSIPAGTRLRYAFMTSEPVGSQQFYLRVRYSAVGSNVKARIGINGSPLTTVTFAPTGSWDSYNITDMWWNVPFVTSPASLKAIPNGAGAPNNIPYAVYLEIEADPGSMFPDLDMVWLEP